MLKKIMNWISPVDDPEDQEQESGKPADDRADKRKNDKLAYLHQVASNSNAKIVIQMPQSFEDVPHCAEFLVKKNTAVVVYFQHLDGSVRQRIHDALSGVIYALDGKIEHVADYAIIYAPPGFDISRDTSIKQ